MARPRRPGRQYRPGYDDPRYKASRLQLKRTGNHICHWCRYPIDMQLQSPHPLSWSCDHRIPRAHLTADDPRQWHIDWMLEAHRRCNESRGAKSLPSDNNNALETSIDW